MKAFLQNFLIWFLTITTGILAIVGLNVFKYETISTIIIPQIFAASFVTSLVTTGFFNINPKKPIKKAVRVLLVLAHYLSLCAIIMALGYFFDWFELTLKGALGVTASVAGVYFISAVISYLLSKGEAKEMTDALEKFNKDDE